MIIREATEDDNLELLKLTQDCSMDGIIKLIIDRKPDFFSLLKIKGEYKVLIAEKNQHIIGTFALVIKHSYIDKSPEKIGYLCDLKIAPAYRSAWVAYRLIKAMYDFMQTLPVNFYLCVIAKGNLLVEELLKGRTGIPAALMVSEFHVFQFLPLKKLIPSKYRIEKFENCFQSEVISLLNQYYRDFQFSTVFNSQHKIDGDIAWVAYENNRIAAFISLIDTAPYKQNIVVRIPPYLKVLLWLIRYLWPFIRLPNEKEIILMLYIKYLAFTPNGYHLVLALVQKARHYAQTKGYSFLSYGIDKRNPIIKYFRPIPKITFHSIGYLFNFSSGYRWNADTICHDNFYQV